MDKEQTADKILSLCEKEGASQVEIFAVTAKTSSIYIDDSAPKIADTKTEFGVGLKYVLGKRVGFTSSTLLSETPEDVVRRASSVARVSSEDPRFVSLPEPKTPSGRRDRFFDKQTAGADSSQLLDCAMRVVRSAVSENVSVPNGVLRASSIDFLVRNSLGVKASSVSTMVFGFFTGKSSKEGLVGEGVQRCWSRKLSAVNFDALGERLQSQAVGSLDADAFKDHWTDIVAVLAPSECSEWLGQLIGMAASAENVNNRSSPWTDRLGDSVAHENLTIVDNGLSESGILSSVIDDEGTPTQKTVLIDRGELKSYFFDSYNGAIGDLASTGNGIRRDPRECLGRFSYPAACGLTTIEVRPGRQSLEDIIGETGRGVYIEHLAWPQVDPTSGTFSNEVRSASLIENGQITRKIKHALLVGNLYESLKREISLGSRAEVHDRGVIPCVAFSGLELVGQ
jgi:PmbA protein